MGPLLRQWLVQWGRQRSLKQWTIKTRHPLLIVLYHHVGPEEKHLRWLYHSRTQAQFEADLQVYQQHFEPVSLSQVYAHATGEQPIERPSVHITFDDGLTSIAEYAWPLLQQYGFHGSVFVNPDFITGPDMLYRMKVSVLIDEIKQGLVPAAEELSMREHMKGRVHGKTTLQQLRNIKYGQRHLLDELGSLARVDWRAYKQGHQIYMNETTLQELADQGLGIGAHSLDHPVLADLSREEQEQQVQQSVAWVQKRFPSQPPVFAFPFTDDGLSRADIERLQTNSESRLLMMGTAGIKQEAHPMHLQRYPMDVRLGGAKQQLEQAFAAAKIKQWLGKYIVAR